MAFQPPLRRQADSSTHLLRMTPSVSASSQRQPGVSRDPENVYLSNILSNKKRGLSLFQTLVQVSVSNFSCASHRSEIARHGSSVFDRVQTNDFDVVGGEVRVAVGRGDFPDPEMLLGEVEKPLLDVTLVYEIVADFVSQQNRAAFE